jgi:hypothetical protein
MENRVYFVRPVGQEGPVKIGYSRKSDERLAALALWSPVALEIVAEFPGGHQTERQFHTMFRHLWSHCEWFNASPELTATIEAIAAGTFDPAVLPERAYGLHQRIPETA